MTKKTSRAWLVVADEAIVKVFEHEPGRGDLSDVQQFTDPGAHARERDLHRDAAGRRGGNGLGPASNATTSAGPPDRQHEAARFAAQVADWLEAARQQQRFDELRLVAAPRFLGQLRKALPGPLEARVVDQLDKDLIHLDHQALKAHLEPMLAGARPDRGPS
jgi:protein required for attachment to host cells